MNHGTEEQKAPEYRDSYEINPKRECGLHPSLRFQQRRIQFHRESEVDHQALGRAAPAFHFPLLR